jgi:hypothetical protein
MADFYRRTTTGSTGNAGKTTLGRAGAETFAPRGFQIQATAANTGKIYVSTLSTLTPNTAIATDGFELSPGQGLFIPPCVDLDSTLDANSVYICSDVASQSVSVMVL